jgi:hypothetical protein
MAGQTAGRRAEPLGHLDGGSDAVLEERHRATHVRADLEEEKGVKKPAETGEQQRVCEPTSHSEPRPWQRASFPIARTAAGSTIGLK